LLKKQLQGKHSKVMPVTTKTVDAIQEDYRQNKGYGLFFPDEP
jgi:hypothetical protein